MHVFIRPRFEMVWPLVGASTSPAGSLFGAVGFAGLAIGSKRPNKGARVAGWRDAQLFAEIVGVAVQPPRRRRDLVELAYSLACR
jgi:hypothetical protein